MFGLKGMAIIAGIGLLSTLTFSTLAYFKGKSVVENQVSLATAQEQLRQEKIQSDLIKTYEATIKAQELDEQALNKIIEDIRKERANVPKDNRCTVDSDFVKRMR